MRLVFCKRIGREVVVGEGKIGTDPLSDQPQPFLPKSMSDASTVATARDVPNDALATGLTDSVPTIPVSGVAPAVPQNAVPNLPSLFGNIIGDKYALMQDF